MHASAALRIVDGPYYHLMSGDVDELRHPSVEDEARYWALVEAAWAQCSAEANRARRALTARAPDREADP